MADKLTREQIEAIRERGKWTDFARSLGSDWDALCDMALSPALTAAREALERDDYKRACKAAGICMTCVLGAPDTFGCTDCLNTGWDGGSPAGFVPEAKLTAAEAEAARLREALRNLELAILYNGDWNDDGFYHNGTPAPELEGPLDAARAALTSSRPNTEQEG